MPDALFKQGDFVKEGLSYGIVLTSGRRTLDIVWIGGSTSRYRHGVRDIKPADEYLTDRERAHLVHKAKDAREERRTGAGVKRGQIWPSR